MKILSVAALLICGQLYSQSVPQDSIKTKKLEEVVVTGQFEPQSVSKSVFGVRTISMEKIQAKGAVKLQDVLNTELNIRFDQDLALGGSNISIQGLAGQNVKVLIDGIPMVGRQGTSNEININQININSIERIEIIEGPMSVVYGADALAGVINIITKKSPEGKLDLNARIHEETVGDEYGLKKGIHNQSAGGGYSWNNFNTRIDFSRNYFGGFQGTAEDRDKQWHPKTQYLGNALFGYAKNRTNLYYRLDYLNEDIYNPGLFEGNEALDQNYITNRFMHQVQGSHAFSDKLSFNTALGFTSYDRETQSTTVNKTTGAVRLALGAGLQDVTHFNGFTGRGTFQYKINNKLSFQPGFDLNYETGEGGRIKEGTQKIGDYALFLSGEWNITPRIQVRPGVRVIHNTVYQAPPAVPSINTKFKITDKQDFRLSYGRGFRAPSLRELYFNFFDASHSIEGNPDLEAELSHSFNGSYTWRVLDNESFKLTSIAGGFYNLVDNMISNGQKPGNTLVTTYINIDKYKTKGLTLNNTLRGNRWDFTLGLGYTGRFNQYSESINDLDEFVWSPELTSSATYRVPKMGLSFSAYYKYTGTTPYYVVSTENGTQVATLAKIPSFSWADVTVQKEFLKNFTASAGVRNLFDVTSVTSTSTASGAHTAGAVRPIGYGRSYFASISYSINKY